MSSCPKKGEPDSHQYQYKIYIKYNIRDYMPSSEWRNFTGDELPKRVGEFDKKKRDKQSIFSKYEKKKESLKVGDTVVYLNVDRPEHHKKKAKIIEVRKPMKEEDVYKKFMSGEISNYVPPPNFKRTYKIKFEGYSPDELRVGDEVVDEIKIKKVSEIQKVGEVVYTLCLPNEKISELSKEQQQKLFQDKIVSRGFPRGVKFSPEVIKAKYKDQQKLPTKQEIISNSKISPKDQDVLLKRLKSYRTFVDKNDLVAPDENQKFKIIDAELYGWDIDDSGKKITIQVKLGITTDGKGAMNALINFADTFNCSGHRAKMAGEISKLMTRKKRKSKAKAMEKLKYAVRRRKTRKKIEKRRKENERKSERKRNKLAKLKKIQKVWRGHNTRKKLGDIIKGGKRRKRTRKRRGGEKCPQVNIGQFKKYDEDKKVQHIKDIKQQCSKNKDCEWAMNDKGPQSHDCRELNCSADHKHTGKNGENCKPKGKCIFDWQTKKCAKFGDLKQDDFIFNLEAIRAALHKAVAEKREQREIARLKRMEAEYESIMTKRERDLEVSHGNFYRNAYYGNQWVPATPLRRKPTRPPRTKSGPPLIFDDEKIPARLMRQETGLSTDSVSTEGSPPTTPRGRSRSELVPPGAPKKRGTKRKSSTMGGKNRKKKSRRKKRRKSRRKRTRRRKKRRKSRRRKKR